MAQNHDRIRQSAAQDFFPLRSTVTATMPTTNEDDGGADADEPPDHLLFKRSPAPEFHRSIVIPQRDRKESLLTKALHPTSPVEAVTPQIHIATDMSRRRSTISNTSAASMADLTSDGGITSPARTDTPSPPLPNSTFLTLAHYTLERKAPHDSILPMVKHDPKDDVISQPFSPRESGLPKVDPAVEALVKKRCISFACGGQKPKSPTPAHLHVAKTGAEPHKTKRSMIKFACPFPKEVENDSSTNDVHTAPVKAGASLKHTRSPSTGRKAKHTPSPHPKFHRDSTSTIRRQSQSPTAVRRRKPTFVVEDEEALKSSEATHFHEFATDEIHEDDWIRRDTSDSKEKITIKDTLKKENAIRQLGEEAEQEAMDDDETAGELSEDNEDDDDMDDQYDDDDESIAHSDDEELGSDGNETDNEAGFADSDDEIDTAGEYQFWTPARSIFAAQSSEANTFRASARRTASESSIDSLKPMDVIAQGYGDTSTRKIKPSRKVKIRPGTPDLPDSTDFVCGTLDEDRPLEEAYVSCMEARKREKHRLIPQDIDPSFPTSDPEDEGDKEDAADGNESEEQVWLHGKFEDSDEDGSHRHRRQSRNSPAHSPTRLHSPPPPKRHHSPGPVKHRHRSPPPRRLFGGHSPKRTHSPPPAQVVRSPPASPTAAHGGISFAPHVLARRPGLTHTKSLPRRPHGFVQHYQAARLSAVTGDDDSDPVEGHTRGAIDIVKGLEHKRQRRKEKFFQKMCNRARKGQQPERRPTPGKGAERMRDIALHMAGKIEYRNGKAEYVLSV